MIMIVAAVFVLGICCMLFMQDSKRVPSLVLTEAPLPVLMAPPTVTEYPVRDFSGNYSDATWTQDQGYAWYSNKFPTARPRGDTSTPWWADRASPSWTNPPILDNMLAQSTLTNWETNPDTITYPPAI